MARRTALMYAEIACFVSCLSGWVLICSTLATEYWIVSESASVVLNAGSFYSNLWMDCLSDSTGVSDCRYFPSMMDLSVFFHTSRALAVVSVISGFGASVLALVGMRCTKIGGSELVNARVTFAAALTYLTSGLCGMTVYSLWGEKTRAEFVDPYYLELKYELGAALFIGWAGSCVMLCGGSVLCYFSARESFPHRFDTEPQRPPTYMTRRSVAPPGSFRPATVVVPSLYQSDGDGRGRPLSPGTTDTQGSRYSSSSDIGPPQPLLDSAV